MATTDQAAPGGAFAPMPSDELPHGYTPSSQMPTIGTKAHLRLHPMYEFKTYEMTATWQDTPQGPFWVGEITVPYHCVLGWKPLN